MDNTTIYQIVEDQVKAKARELSTWKPVQWEGGRLYYETNRIIQEIKEFDITIQLLYLEKLANENFIIQDNWPSSAPDITEDFRGWITKTISKLKIKKLQKDIELQSKVNSSLRKKRPQIPYKTKALLQKEIDSKCPFCLNRDVDHFEVHHIDENPENNNFDNLLMLCPICHSKITKQDIEIEEVKGVKRKLKERSE